MGGLEHAESFQDLIVYRRARRLAKEIFRVSASFPREENYSLTSQIRRASRSVGAQIAEAWAKRRYTKHFVSKLTDAAAEGNETGHWLETAGDCGYLSADAVAELNSQLSEIGRMLSGMTRKADLFCGGHPGHAREAAAEYFADDETG